jgi:hypothetical protein
MALKSSDGTISVRFDSQPNASLGAASMITVAPPDRADIV